MPWLSRNGSTCGLGKLMKSMTRGMEMTRRIIHETAAYKVMEMDGMLIGHEKMHDVFTGDNRVLVHDIEANPGEEMQQGMDIIGASSMFKPGDPVAIKVNIGGGINGVLSSYTDPDLLSGIVNFLKDMGCKPFVCEADMRGHGITGTLLEKRGYLSWCKEHSIPFKNLSRGRTVRFHFLGIPRDIMLPEILLDPSVKIVSVAPPKHHWECGITCAQKNMYGAIANYKKSRFHRAFDLIDHVVAGAARVMKPTLSIIASKQLGAGLGPHFCIPINFHKAIFAPDMLACDLFCADMLGYPSNLVQYLTINLLGKPLKYKLMEGSSMIPQRTLDRIHAHAIPPSSVNLYKKTLFVQYFIPSWFQFHVYHHFEWFLTWLNHRFYQSRGDSSDAGSGN
ncbi:DUF362 domain-containing protein [Candidatus Bathyarchaeota archaeon]|nr:DUF362 domain-containing protein [Candidatus Bathyarchaeota archaeon]